MPDQDSTFPKTRRDMDELVAERDAAAFNAGRSTGICTSLTVEAAEAAEAFGFNGRETAAWVLGQWSRHYREATDRGYDFHAAINAGLFDMLAVIDQEHLPAVSALLVRTGASVSVAGSSGSRPNDRLTVRIFFS